MHVTSKYENKPYIFGDQLITVSVLWAEGVYHMKKTSRCYEPSNILNAVTPISLKILHLLNLFNFETLTF